MPSVFGILLSTNSDRAHKHTFWNRLQISCQKGSDGREWIFHYLTLVQTEQSRVNTQYNMSHHMHREEPTTLHCLKALEGDISLNPFVKDEWMCVDSRPLWSMNVFQRQCLEFVQPMYNTCVWSIVHEGWSWWCPWRWPLCSSRAGHQGQLHPVPLLSFVVKSAWGDLLLEPQPPEASLSDTADLRQGKQHIYLCYYFNTKIFLTIPFIICLLWIFLVLTDLHYRFFCSIYMCLEMFFIKTRHMYNVTCFFSPCGVNIKQFWINQCHFSKSTYYIHIIYS